MTSLNILHFSINEFTNLDGKHKTDFIRELHVKVRTNIEKKNEQYTNQASKRRVKVTYKKLFLYVWQVVIKALCSYLSHVFNLYKESLMFGFLCFVLLFDFATCSRHSLCFPRSVMSLYIYIYFSREQMHSWEKKFKYIFSVLSFVQLYILFHLMFSFHMNSNHGFKLWAATKMKNIKEVFLTYYNPLTIRAAIVSTTFVSNFFTMSRITAKS